MLPIATVVVRAAVPALYMTATMLPSGFLNASASTAVPVVATRLAPGATYCEKWRKT